MKWYDVRLNAEEIEFLTAQLETDKNIFDDCIATADNDEDMEVFTKRYDLCNKVLDALYNYKQFIKEV